MNDKSWQERAMERYEEKLRENNGNPNPDNVPYLATCIICKDAVTAEPRYVQWSPSGQAYGQHEECEA